MSGARGVNGLDPPVQPEASGDNARYTAASSSRAPRLLLMWTVALLAAGLAMLALLRICQAAVTVTELRQLDYAEGIVYDTAARVLRGEPLYRSLDQAPYEVTAYMPLFPVLAAGARLIAGEGFAPGRALSLLAGLVTAALVAWLAARRVGRGAGWFAGALFLALGFPGVAPWLALYRVDLVGVASSLAAIAVLEGGKSRRRVLVAAALASLALLTKQTLFPCVLAGTIWLAERDRRASLHFAGSVLLVVGGVAWLLEATTGAFFANTVASNVNPMGLDILASNLGFMALYQAGPMAAAAIGVVRRGRRVPARRDLLVLYWLASWIPLLGMAKAGANHNYWLECAAITAVLATEAVWPTRRRVSMLARRTAAAAVLCLGLGGAVGGAIVFAEEREQLTAAATAPQRAAALQPLIERVRAEPGDVLAEPFDVVVLAGRPVLLEPVIFGILERQGRWDARPIVDRICRGQVRLAVLGMPIERAAQPTVDGIDRWPRPVITALQSTMALEDVVAGRYVYAPVLGSSSPSC